MLFARAARAEGDGKRADDGYVGWVVFGDAIAASLPLALLATTYAQQSFSGGDLTPLALSFVLAPFGPSILAPIIHGAHGRRRAAYGSAAGWIGGALISSVTAMVLLPHACSVDSAACAIDPGRVAAMMAVSASLTVGMTIVDSQLARGDVAPEPRALVTPSIVPVPSGATVGVAGAF